MSSGTAGQFRNYRFAQLVAGATPARVLASAAARMVPSSRRAFPLSLVLALSGIGVIGGMALFFPWRTEDRRSSYRHLLAASRRGALFASAGLGAVLTGLAVFLTLTPLQFQCMFQQATHLLVWHAGTAAILIGLGALMGELRRHRWML